MHDHNGHLVTDMLYFSERQMSIYTLPGYEYILSG